jgi:hypothetical protein
MTSTSKVARNAELVTLARAGWTYDRIAALYGVSRQRVGYLARKDGIRRDDSKARHDLAASRAARARVWRAREAARTERRLTALPAPTDPEETAAFTALRATLRAYLVRLNGGAA